MHPMLNIAIRATRKAGNFIAKCYETPSYNEENNEFVSFVQQQAAQRIIETIHQSYPTHIVTTKYDDAIPEKESDMKWIVDPINGINNFLKRLPHFSISVALRVKGRTEIAIIYDPIRNELFTTTRGHGAQLNGYRLRMNNKTKDLTGSTISTLLSIEQKKHAPHELSQLIMLLINKKMNFHCSGSSALDFAYVAAGRLDSFFAIAIKKQDFWGGEMLVSEAGGLVTDLSGGHDHEISENIIAAHPMMIEALLKAIGEIKMDKE